MVVDLSIERDPDAAILVGHRLPAAAEIYNRQPAVTKTRLSRDE